MNEEGIQEETMAQIVLLLSTMGSNKEVVVGVEALLSEGDHVSA